MSAKFVTIAAVAALFGAAFWTGHLLSDPSFELSADAFGGLYRMDAFGSVAKVLIYLATIACLIVTPAISSTARLSRRISRC
jgi:NADH-quinone oxidoreductase subunit N